VEAVIDLRVLLPSDFSIENLADFQTRLARNYSKPQEIFQDSATITFSQGNAASVAQAARDRLGLRFRRADGKRVLQTRVNGFAFSAMAPYDGWSQCSSEARELWGLYKEVTRPMTVTRVAVRYINRIDLPVPADEQAEPLRLETYFATYPQITERLRFNAFSGFIMQLQVPQPDIESMLLINQRLVDRPSPEVVSVVLDFDLFRVGEWDAQDDGPIWDFLEVLHDRKNEAFEASITEDARRLFG
jgi:uncharacterized protein (TIGR04255 family)